MNNKKAIILDNLQLVSEAFAEVIKNTKLFDQVHYSINFNSIEKYLGNDDQIFLFIDFYLKDIDIVKEIAKLKSKIPSIIVIVVSIPPHPNIIIQIRKAGANGFVSKNATKKEFISCFKSVTTGNFYMNSSLRDEMVSIFLNDNHPILTVREREILKIIATGKSINEMANHLNISKHTIIAHRRNIMEKLEVNSVLALIVKSNELGLI